MRVAKKILLKILPWLVVAGVGYFFYETLRNNWGSLQAETGSLSFDAWAALGVACFTLAVVLSGILWGRMLSLLSGKPVAVADSVRIHSASWLLKYLPGQVGSYVNKISWGSRQGISKKTVSTSFIYENTLMMFAGLLLSVPVFWMFSDKLGDGVSILLPLVVLVPMLVVMMPKAFYSLLNFAFEKLGRKPFKESDFLSAKDLLKYQLGYLGPRILNGVGFVLVVMSVYTVEPSMYVGMAAVYILAGILGLLAIFVPGGIGVREAVIVLFLSVYFPVEQAVVLAIVSRLYATVADLGVGLVYLVLNKGRVAQL